MAYIAKFYRYFFFFKILILMICVDLSLYCYIKFLFQSSFRVYVVILLI